MQARNSTKEITTERRFPPFFAKLSQTLSCTLCIACRAVIITILHNNHVISQKNSKARPLGDTFLSNNYMQLVGNLIMESQENRMIQNGVNFLKCCCPVTMFISVISPSNWVTTHQKSRQTRMMCMNQVHCWGNLNCPVGGGQEGKGFWCMCMQCTRRAYPLITRNAEVWARCAQSNEVPYKMGAMIKTGRHHTWKTTPRLLSCFYCWFSTAMSLLRHHGVPPSSLNLTSTEVSTARLDYLVLLHGPVIALICGG